MNSHYPLSTPVPEDELIYTCVYVSSLITVAKKQLIVMIISGYKRLEKINCETVYRRNRTDDDERTKWRMDIWVILAAD